MEPASIVAVTATSIGLLKTILEASLGLHSALGGIRSIDEATNGLAEEVDSFRFLLLHFESELQHTELSLDIGGYWDPAKLDELFTNALKTYSRLDTIVKDVGRHKGLLPNVRQYWRSKSYDKEIQHLRLRIGTYITALRIPIELIHLHKSRQTMASRSPPVVTDTQRPSRDMDSMAVQILGDRVNQLGDSIEKLSRNIAGLQNQESNAISSTLRQESEQLVHVAQSLALSAAGTNSQMSMASSDQASTVVFRENERANFVRPDGMTGYQPSVYGAPLSSQSRTQIRDWIGEISSASAPTLDGMSGDFTEGSVCSDFASTQFSAPSTVQQSPNLKMRLADARLKKAQGLMAEKKFGEAVPHLQRTIQLLKSNPEYFGHEVKLHRLQISLAKAIVKSDVSKEEAEPLLRAALESGESSPEEESEAAHQLTLLLSKSGPTRLAEAKEIFERAIELRISAFGPDDTKTYQLIAIGVEICRQLRDSDEQLWRDMLPASFKMSRNLSAWKLRRKFEGGLDPLPTLSPDGMVMAFASPDFRVVLCDMWSWHTKQELKGHLGRICSMAFSPDGKIIASASEDGAMNLWDATSGVVRHTIVACDSSAFDSSLTFSPDSSLLASINHQWRDARLPKCAIRLWYVTSGVARLVFTSHSSEFYLSITFSPGGKLLAVRSSDGSVKLLDTATWSHKNTLVGQEKSFCARFSPDGRLLAVPSKDFTINLHTAVSGTVLRVLKGHSKVTRCVTFSPNGELLVSASDDGKATVWDTATGKATQELDAGRASVSAVAFSPDGKLLATGSEDCLVRLWNTATWTVRQMLESHRAPVTSVAFSTDGGLLMSVSKYDASIVWDTNP